MLNRRVKSKVDYVLRIQDFVIKPKAGAVIPAKYAEDPIIDRHIRANILEGELLADLLAKVEGAKVPVDAKKEESKPASKSESVVESTEDESASGPAVESKEESSEDTPPEDEKPAEVKEEEPKPVVRKKSKKKTSK